MARPIPYLGTRAKSAEPRPNNDFRRRHRYRVEVREEWSTDDRAPFGNGETPRPAVPGRLQRWYGLLRRSHVPFPVAPIRGSVGIPSLVAVDYRRAPENPAPCPVEDSHAAPKGFSGNAKSICICIYPARLVIYGDSAGGLAHMTLSDDLEYAQKLLHANVEVEFRSCSRYMP